MSDLLEYKGYSGTVEYSEADGLLCGKVVGVKGYLSYAGTDIASLKADFEDMIEDYLELCREEGLEPQKPYKGSFNVRIAPELHRNLALYSASQGKSLNSAVEEAIRNYVNG